MAIWVTSDWHFNHSNILGFCRSQFTTIEEHNDCIVRNFNSVVGPDDLVYVLGDVGFSPSSKLTPIIKQLKGRKVLLIGNHDLLTNGDYLRMGFIDIIRHPVYYSSNIILSHYPLKECLNNPWTLNLHGHIHDGSLSLPNFFNVNVELHDYFPLNIEEFEKVAKQKCLPSRYQPFGKEWYSQWETKGICSCS